MREPATACYRHKKISNSILTAVKMTNTLSKFMQSQAANRSSAQPQPQKPGKLIVEWRAQQAQASQERSSPQQQQPGKKLIVEWPQEDDESSTSSSATITSSSVKFNLDITTVHRYEVEKEDASNAWSNRGEMRSFKIHTFRCAQACRELMEAGRHRDITEGEAHCIQGIEHLVSPSARRGIVSTSSLKKFTILCCLVF